MINVDKKNGLMIITHYKFWDTNIFHEIVFGIEEEQVPYYAKAIEKEIDLIKLAYSAALQSNFEVGIGYNCRGVCIHHMRFDLKQPLIVIDYEKMNLKIARLIGNDSARLIKGFPLHLY